VRRVSLTLKAMAGGPDRLLGLFVADPEMPGDAVHHHPLRRVGAGLSVSGQFLDRLQNRSAKLRCPRGLFGIFAIGVQT
jgi:hypothetical protein